MAILIVTLAIAVIALGIALIVKSKKYDQLVIDYDEKNRDYNFLKSDYRKLRDFNTEILGSMRMQKPKYKEFHKFILVSADFSNYLEQMSKRFEEEDYEFDKDKSFPTVLCFTKRIEILETKENTANKA